VEEDRHLDGRACLAVACGVVSLLVFASTATGILFGAWAWIWAGASVLGDEERASRRTWRTVVVAVLLTLPALGVLLFRVFEAPPLGA
jgi:hypothetical protein